MNALTRFTAATRVRFDVMNKMADEIEARDVELNDKNVAQDAAINNRVTYDEYDVKMMQLDDKNESQDEAIARKVEQSVYNTKMTELDNKNTSQDAAINSRVLQTSYDTKMAELDSKNTEQDTAIANKVNNSTFTAAKTALETAIAGKVLMNGTATNVNFKERKVVQDGLVYNGSNITSSVVTTSNQLTNESYIKFRFSVSSLSSTQFICGNRSNSSTGFYVAIYTNGNMSIYTDTDHVITTVVIGMVYDVQIIVKNGTLIVTVNNITTTVPNYLTSTFNFVLLSVREGGTVASSTKINYVQAYNRILTQQEIQHNFSVLNNQTSISSIETTDSSSVKTSFLIGTKTDLIETRTGHTEEERYTALLSKFGKKYTSTGEDITVANAIENQRMLSAVIKGQTIKCATELSTKITVSDMKGVPLGTTATDTNGKQYTLSVYVSAITNTPVIQLFSGSSGSVASRISNVVLGLNKITFTYERDTISGIGLASTSGSDSSVTIDWVSVVEGSTGVASYIPFGLNSTQATLSNNGLKYSFYLNLEDKLAGRVIDLGGMEGARNTWELKEDGSGVYTQNTVKYIVTGNENWINFEKNANGISYALLNLQTKVGVKGICNRLENATTSAIEATTESFKVDSGGLYIRLFTTKANTIDEFKNTLKTEYTNNNPYIIQYVLATPIVTTIDKELVPAILTQATNTFTFGDAVAPYKVTIQAPTTDDIAKSYPVTLLNGYTQTVGTATPVVNLANTGIVRLQMDLTAPATGMNATIFTLPTELRPVTNSRIPVFVNGVSQLATIDKTTGNVNLASIPTASANIYIKTDYRRDI